MPADGEGVDDVEPGDDVSLEHVPLHSTNLLTVLDEEGIVRYESPAIERIYGFGAEELVGEQVAEFFHPDDREAVIDAFRTIVGSEEYAEESIEYRHECADGSYCWVESVASSSTTPEGHYVVNTRDVSERRERERTLVRTNERLERFASVVGHDLRNPLNVANQRLLLAMEECDDPNLAHVERAHERMEALIDDLLTLARAGNPIDGTEPVDLAAVGETCWRTVATADASFETDVDRPIEADRSRLRQVFENLVRNAVEHGGDDVVVRLCDLDDGDGFYVADDGTGIAEDVRDRVVEGGYSETVDGVGLGLTIVRDVADAHGWKLRVTESRDGGARFEFTGVERP